MTPRSLLAPARLAGQPVLRTQSDERLVDLVRAGSEPAFEAIVSRYRRPLLRYCTRILPEERAEDVVQQAFVRAYDSMRSREAELALRPWLYRIAHNTALNALRDRGLRHEALDESIDGVEQPDQALERAQGVRAVLGAVRELPARQRDAIVLREIEGKSYDEIAVELGVTGGAVRQLLNRARHSVRAAATAVTPAGLLERLAWTSQQPLGERLAELCGAAGGGAVLAKLCATALVTGAVVGGVAVAPEEKQPAASGRPATGAARADQRDGGGPSGSGQAADRGAAPARGALRSRGQDHSGRGGSGTTEAGDDHAVPGSGDGEGGHSGRRDGELTLRRDSSGPGSGDGDHRSGSPVSGSGSGEAGSGTSGSGSSGEGSGSGSLDSGFEMSGSGTSGSGSGGSGSGTSGSGSGGDGSADGLSSSGSG